MSHPTTHMNTQRCSIVVSLYVPCYVRQFSQVSHRFQGQCLAFVAVVVVSLSKKVYLHYSNLINYTTGTWYPVSTGEVNAHVLLNSVGVIIKLWVLQPLSVYTVP